MKKAIPYIPKCSYSETVQQKHNGTCIFIMHILKRSPGIIRKSRVSYPGPGFLSSATWPSLPNKHYNGINQTKLTSTTTCNMYVDKSKEIFCPQLNQGKYKLFHTNEINYFSANQKPLLVGCMCLAPHQQKII